MMKYNVIVTDNAKDDIRLIKKFFAKNGRASVQKFVDKLRKIIFILRSYPFIGKGRIGVDSDILFFPFHAHYLISYMIVENKIFILRVLTGFEDIQSIF